MNEKIENIVIVGGGSAGWMSAALLAKLVGKHVNIQLIESDAIGIVGVGEATIPPMETFNAALGIDESEFMAFTKGTFKLGIQFENWGKANDCYMHAFGEIGRGVGMTPFHHYYLRKQQQQADLSLWDFSLNYQAAKQNKFTHLNSIPKTPLAGIRYAYHFDAALYAKFLRNFSEKLGVNRIEGKIVTTSLRADDGYIESVTLESGQVIEGDLFIDCSGFSALLIEQALNTGYDDWSAYLPCDRAWAVPTERTDPIVPYTRSIAHDAGWQWRIPLQSRTGNGMVYCSKFISDQDAKQTLLNNLDSKPLAEPRLIKFKTGKRKKLWNKNCLAVGLSSGFLEPLESTSIHLIQSSIVRLIKFFPDKAFNQVDIDEYNRQADIEYQQIRDFIILHYRLNQKHDLPFWLYCQKMDIPESLQHKMDLFESSGRIFREQEDLFSEVAWLQVMLGQNLQPQSYHSMADHLSKEQHQEFLSNLSTVFKNVVSKMPMHNDYLNKYCKAD